MLDKMPPRRRSRAKPVNDVSVGQYVSLVRDWLSSGPAMTVERCDLESTYTTRAASASPAWRVFVFFVLQSLIDSGHATGVVFGKRLEVAIHKFLCDNPHCTEVASDAELVANITTNHVMAHLSMLRDLKEESRPGALWPSRKFPKTGRSRKALGQTHWAWLSPLLARMSLDGEGGGEEEELEWASE